MVKLLLAVGLAVCISAMCSIAEAVLYSIPWSFIEHLRKAEKRSGRLLNELRTNIDRPITAILTLNTIANTAGAAVAGASAAVLFGSEILGIFSGVFTFVILVFSEVLPKTIGVAYNRQIAPYMAMPLWILVVIMTPVSMVLRLIVRLVEKKKKGPHTTEDELHAIVTLTRRAGVIKPYEELSIKNILSLDLKSAKDIMTPRTVIFSLSVNLTVSEAKATKDIWPHSRIPVYDKDPEDIVGIVYRRELFEALANDQDDLPLSELMKPVHFALEHMFLDKLLVKFLESRTHICIILDEYGGLSGLVTLEDILEEILGSEIVDESDVVADMRELARMKKEKLIKEQGKKS